jgi:hypothetical protein
MRRRGCIARENWPGRSRGRRCSCGGCRRQEIEELAERSLSAALAHAQNRGESEAGSGFGDELTIDKDVSVIWGPRYNLATWLVNPACRAGDASPRDPGQWLYKIFLGPARAPLYLGKVTGDSTSLHERIRKHTTRGTAIPALTAATVAAEITRNKARLRAGDPSARTESQIIDDIIASLGSGAFQISCAEVRRLKSGRRVRAYATDTSLAEKHYHRKNAARINSRDNPRFEEELGSGFSREADGELSQLVGRIVTALGHPRSGKGAVRRTS